jgi:GMP synthase (glutamine-hydrolysing)
MKVHFVVHESYEGPGALTTWADRRGHDASRSRTYLGERVPSTADGIDLLVVLGGPQGPGTTVGECPHFNSAAEQALIRDAMTTGVMVVGICLGAQLMSAALGAGWERASEPEIGVHPIRLTAAGTADRRMAGFAPGLDVGHWHRDMPGLPAGAKVLASSRGCSRQVIRYDELAYGFQCHPEFTRESVVALIETSAADLAAARGRPYVQGAAEILQHAFEPMNAALFSFLDRLTADYATTGRTAGAGAGGLASPAAATSARTSLVFSGAAPPGKAKRRRT